MNADAKRHPSYRRTYFRQLSKCQREYVTRSIFVYRADTFLRLKLSRRRLLICIATPMWFVTLSYIYRMSNSMVGVIMVLIRFIKHHGSYTSLSWLFKSSPGNTSMYHL
jgi:hypothetical protein